MRSLARKCKQDPACAEKVQAGAAPFLKFEPRDTGKVDKAGAIDFEGEMDLKSIRWPAYFGQAPYDEPIAEADDRIYVVEFTVPRDAYERSHLKRDGSSSCVAGTWPRDRVAAKSDKRPEIARIGSRGHADLFAKADFQLHPNSFRSHPYRTAWVRFWRAPVQPTSFSAVRRLQSKHGTFHSYPVTGPLTAADVPGTPSGAFEVIPRSGAKSLPLSLHEASVAVMAHMLGQLSTILDKAVAHAEAAGLDPATLVEARLAPDMFALARQVQIASDTAKGCAARLAGLQPPSYPDTETSFPELKERIAKTLRFLEDFGPERIDGREDDAVTIRLRDQTFTFSGRDYLLRFALPNFYFHLTTAYDILRQQGAALGKRDFLGELPASASPDEARPA